MMSTRIRIVVFVSLSFLFISPALVFAGWTGPQQILSGSWGKDIGQFYYAFGDMFDEFPKTFAIDNNGLIIIADEGNSRITIFNGTGVLEKTITKPPELPQEDSAYGWPSDLRMYVGGNSLVISCQYQKVPMGLRPSKKCFLDYNGVLLSKIDFGQTFPVESGFIILRNNTYFLYSPTGQLIQTYTSRPLELGLINSQKTGTGAYKTTIKYPDFTYAIISNQPIVKYYRDLGKYIYQIETFTDKSNDEEITSYRVHKYNMCNKEVLVLDIPKSEYKPMPPEATDLPTWKPVPIIEYGEPIVSSGGDIYCWARTETEYKILKWTWEDDPNAPPGVPNGPTNLAVSALATGLVLSWKASLQDPGCVTDYEIVRSETAGGPYMKLGTVTKGILRYEDTTAITGTTYYYKVRALSGKEYSEYSNEAVGKR
jgi:hypothetical protein